MGTVTRKHYKGWNPSADAINGPKDELLAMSNLELDEQGIVSLTRGMNKVSSNFGSPIFGIFSKNFGSVKHRYVQAGTTVKKDIGSQTYPTTVLSGGSTKSAFGAALGFVLVTSGTQKKKDDGITIRDLGMAQIPIVSGTTIAANLTPTAILAPNTGVVLDEGTSGGGSIVNLNTTSFRATARFPYGGDRDLTFLQSAPFATDIFTFTLTNSVALLSVRIEFLLDTSAALGTDYFYAEFVNTPTSQFVSSVNVSFQLVKKRSEFIRVGTNSALSWQNVKGARITVVAGQSGSFTYDTTQANTNAKGGVLLRPAGVYEYRLLPVLNTGSYVGKGPVSAADITISTNSRMIISITSFPSTSFNEVWIYRKVVGIYDTYYRVGVVTSNGPFNDTVSDLTAIENNIRIDDVIFNAAIPDNIIGIEGLYFDRMMYITNDALYITPRFQLDSVDTRFTLDTSSDNVEKNLWIKKTSASSLLLGTTKDIYELSGTGRLFPDGTLDFLLRPLGISNPPISRASTVYDGAVVYMAKDGWRIVSGSRYENITAETRLLYEGKTRHDYPPTEIVPDDLSTYACAVSRNKLWAAVTRTDGGHICYTLDLIKGYWYPYFISPLSLFVEDDGKILGGFGDPGNAFLRELDNGTLIDNVQQQQMRLLTAFDDMDAENRRKDLYTLKLFFDTGNSQVTISLAKDGGALVSLGTSFAGNGPTRLDIPVNSTSLNLGKTFQLEIKNTGLGVADFKLYHWSLDFETRPEQLNHLRIPPNNYGVAGRKRFYEIPISIDTLGNNTTLTPIIDGVLKTALTINSNGKLYKNYLFDVETIGRELGWDLQGNGNSVFELYEIINPKILEILPDPSEFLHLPYDNLGVPSRKRFITIAFVIDTRSSNVTFTPRLDGIAFPTSIVHTNRKRTYIHYFATNAVGIDIGGDLSGVNEFEFYGWLKEDTVFEKLPAPGKFVNLSCTNFGIPARKRVRTVPFVIDTKGQNVTITPTVDGILQTVSVHNTTGKRTVFHYFSNDVFGIDYCFTISGATEFEFYEMLKPYQVEVLPVARKYDQVGPVTISRIGKIREILLRILPTTSEITLQLFAEGVSVFLRNISVTANIDDLYRIDVPKTVKGTTFRLEISATDIFHRFYADFRYVEGGNENTLRKIRVEDVSLS